MAQVRRDEKKIKKYRGSRLCGYGTQGQHRKGGQRGGRGKAGRKKHKWTYVVKYEPDYFGKHGFKRPPFYQREIKIINVGELNEKINKFLQENKAKKEGDLITINLIDLGYDKLLGKGKINIPLKVIIKSYSKKALNKITEAGGQIITPEEITQ